MRTAKNNPIRIQRMNELELDKAIADLEKRGFQLMNRGIVGSTYKETSYRQGSFIPYKYAGTSLHQQHYAVLRKGVAND